MARSTEWRLIGVGSEGGRSRVVQFHLLINICHEALSFTRNVLRVNFLFFFLTYAINLQYNPAPPLFSSQNIRLGFSWPHVFSYGNAGCQTTRSTHKSDIVQVTKQKKTLWRVGTSLRVKHKKLEPFICMLMANLMSELQYSYKPRWLCKSD